MGVGNVNRIGMAETPQPTTPSIEHHCHHRSTEHQEVQVSTRANLHHIALSWYYALSSPVPLSLAPTPVIIIQNTNDMMSPRGQMTGSGKVTAWGPRLSCPCLQSHILRIPVPGDISSSTSLAHTQKSLPNKTRNDNGVLFPPPRPPISIPIYPIPISSPSKERER